MLDGRRIILRVTTRANRNDFVLVLVEAQSHPFRGIYYLPTQHQAPIFRHSGNVHLHHEWEIAVAWRDVDATAPDPFLCRGSCGAQA